MGRAGKTADTAVLTPTVGIDRAVKGNVGRTIAGDHRAAGVYGNFRGERREFIVDATPTVVEGFLAVGLELAGKVACRSASLTLQNMCSLCYCSLRIAKRTIAKQINRVQVLRHKAL